MTHTRTRARGLCRGVRLGLWSSRRCYGSAVRLRSGYVSRGGPGATARASGEGNRRSHSPLQSVEACLHGALVVERRGQQHPRADQLQLEPGRGRAAHLRKPGVDQVGGPAQLGRAQHLGLCLHALDDIGGGVDQPLLPGVRHGGQDHQVPQPLQQVGDEPPRIVTPLDDLLDDLEGGRSVPGREGVDDGVEQRPVRIPEQARGHGVRHTVLGHTREQLVHDGHRVTHGPAARADDQRQHPVGDGHLLLRAHLGQVVAQRPRGNEPEGIVVRTRPDRADDLLGLGGREDELQMLGRLLDHLQQGVEPRRGDHVRLVDDVDLVPAAGGPEEGLLPQVTGVVHATVRSRVDLDDVDRPRPVPGQVLTGLAHAARRRRRPLLAVQTAREDPCTGRLPTAARPAEQVRVIDPVVTQRLLQRVSDMLLPDDLGERLGAVTAIQRKGRHTYDDIGPLRQRPHTAVPRPIPRPVPPGPRKRPPRTRQSQPTLAAFRPWGSSVR